MILKFEQFLLESSTTGIVELLSSLTRNYNSTNTFNTDITHFRIDKEERNWKDLRQNVELQKAHKTDANLVMEFELDKKEYKLECDFTISYTGQNEKDSPEPTAQYSQRLAVVLDSIDIRRLRIESQSLNYDSKPNNEIDKAIEPFLIKVLEVDYDLLSSKIYSIEQK